MKPTEMIYIERLRSGKSQAINVSIDPAFMDIQEKELVFKEPIIAIGEAYLADDWLIVRLQIAAFAELRCAVCNDLFRYPISIQEMTHEEPLENIPEKTFDILPLLRETILLEIPFYPQCGIDKCKNRNEVEKYIKKESDGKNGHPSPGVNRPFEGLL